MGSGKPGPGWRIRTEVIELLGVSTTAFDRTYYILVPEDAKKVDGKRTWIHFPTLLREIRAKEKQQAKSESSPRDPDGSLEAKRKIETQRIELELKKALRQVVAIDEVAPVLGRFASRLASYGDSVGRKETTGGADVQRTLNEIIAEGMESFERLREMDDGS